jgi:16S rRNA processing protein RimM
VSGEELIAIAKVVRPRGLKGELVAEILTDFPERFETLDAITGLSPDGRRKELIIEKFWFQNDRVILKFKGYNTIESGEELRNFEVCVPEADAVELEDDEFFDWQLEGCVVEDVNGKGIGVVRELMRTGGTELLVVEGDLKEYLIPFAASICVSVDIDKNLIKVDPPEGLLDF